MAAMTLTLKLSGVTNLLNAVNRLNLALNKLNNGLNSAAKQVNNAAQKMGAAVNIAKGKMPNSGGSGGSGRLGGTKGVNQQDLGSMLFSGFAGQWRIAMAKAFTRLAVNIINNRIFPKSGANGPPPAPDDAVAAVAANLIKLGMKLAIIVGLIATTVAALTKLAEFVAKIGNQQLQLRMASFGNSQFYGQARGIQAALNMSPEEMASALRNKNGPGQLINEIKTLYGMKNDEQAEAYARARGITNFLPIRNLSQDEFNDAMNTKGLGKDVGDSSAKFNQSIGKFKQSIENAAAEFAPFLDGLSYMISALSSLAPLMAKIVHYANPLIAFISGIGAIIDYFIHLWNKFHGKKDEESDKSKQAADKFNNAVDKFSDAVGTYGGGDRARGAIPKAWGWYSNQQYLIHMADNLGAMEF